MKVKGPENSFKSEGDVLLALRDHFDPKVYVVLPQVRNGAGFSSTRTADALVMSTWPSRGLDLYGVEIKVSRADWLREQKNPKKSDEIAAYCDYWLLALGDEAFAKPEEVPEPWGILVPGKKTGKFRVLRPAKKLEAKPMSRSFLAVILRKTLETVVPLSTVDAEIERRVTEKVTALEGLISQRLAMEFDPNGLMADNAKLLAAAQAFKDATGVWLSAYDTQRLKQLGRALKLMEWQGFDEWLDRYEKALSETAEKVKKLRDALPKGALSAAVGMDLTK